MLSGGRPEDEELGQQMKGGFSLNTQTQQLLTEASVTNCGHFFDKKGQKPPAGIFIMIMVFTCLYNPGKTTRLHSSAFMGMQATWRSRFHFLNSPQHLWRISLQHLSLKAVTGLSVSDQSLNRPPGVSLPKSSARFGSPGDRGSRHPLKKGPGRPFAGFG